MFIENYNDVLVLLFKVYTFDLTCEFFELSIVLMGYMILIFMKTQSMHYVFIDGLLLNDYKSKVISNFQYQDQDFIKSESSSTV